MDGTKPLSQQEIDALLAILPVDGSPLPGDEFIEKPARIYDFRSPDKFSKEQIRTLQMIHENFSRRFSSSLSVFLRAMVQIVCADIQQGSFADFLMGFPSRSFIAVLRMDPLPGRVLLAMDAITSTVIIDRLLGGYGHAAASDHLITDLEQSLLRGIVKYAVEALEDGWRNVITLSIAVEETTLSAEFVQVALPSDAAVFLTFETKVRDHNGMMSICLPYSVLKPIATELSPHAWVAGETRESSGYREAMIKHLKKAEVEVSVQLGEMAVDFEELLYLQVGDVLVLDSVAGRPLPVLIGKRKKYLAQPGLAGSHLAVQVMSVVEEMDDNGGNGD
jgi:flagellar motor switch protein FliM